MAKNSRAASCSQEELICLAASPPFPPDHGRAAWRLTSLLHTVGNSQDIFLKRVGKEYPNPRVAEGRRRLWLKDDLDAAILPAELSAARDVAGDL